MMPNQMIGLLGLVFAGLFLAGCATNSAVARMNQPNRSLVVVPVKGQPISVRSIHASTAIGFGIIGGQIEQAATTSSSGALCARLNQDASFDGERILAEECAKLLQASPKVAFRAVTVQPTDAAMPGVKDMEASEQQRFKVNCPNVFKWSGNLSEWKKGPPVAGNVSATGQHTVFLEVTFRMVVLNHHDKIDPAILDVRLVDAETGEMLGFSSSAETYKITAVTGDIDLGTFESDFRKCMNESARKMLGDLNLL